MSEQVTPVQALKHCDFLHEGLCDPDVVKPLYRKRKIDFGYSFTRLGLITQMNRSSLGNLFQTGRWVRAKTHIILCEALWLDPRTLAETKPAPGTGGLK